MRRIAILLSGLLISIFLLACGNQASNQMADDVLTNTPPSQMESSSSELENSKNEVSSSQEQVSSQETSSANSENQIQIETESGNAISGTEHISTMSGTIYISADSNPLEQAEKSESSLSEASQEEDVKNIQVTVGNKDFTATLSDNAGADAFVNLLKNEPLVINMSDYSGFEKVGSLGTNLPVSNSNITATEGDIILYNGNQICVFYGSNSWSYTRLAKIDDLSGWKEALGSGDVTITYSLL